MAIFQPVNMMGPAHRGGQIQQLAQQAAQNVMRRQRMRSMLRTSAGAARPAVTGAQGLLTAQRGHTGIPHPGLIPNMSAGLMAAAGPGAVPIQPVDTGALNSSGGGLDFQSIPDATDPQQSPQLGGNTPPAGTPPPPYAGAPYLGGDRQPVPPAPSTGGAGTGAASAALAGAASAGNAVGGVGSLFGPGGAISPANAGLIPLNGGLFYDPSTDKVVGSSAAGSASGLGHMSQ